MSNILKQYTKFIFPFQYEKDEVDPLSAQLENKKGNKQNIFEPFSVPAESLRDGLELMLNADNQKSKIADCYQLNINCRKHFLLPAKKTETLTFHARQEDVAPLDVAISEVRIYLFESQVGFVEVECEYKTSIIDDYISLNYFICEAKSDKNYFVYHEKLWDAGNTTYNDICFSMKDLLERVLQSVCKTPTGISFDYRKSKPVIYSHILLDTKPQNTEALLQFAAKNYKQSYKFDDSCMKVNTIHPFENSYWASSLNGAVNVSFLTDDELTNDFFTNSFYTKTKSTYFFLFLNVLHQRYSIIRFMGKMGTLDHLTNDYFIMEEELKLARKYEAEAISLKFRAFFNVPSYVEHINGYYNSIFESFQVGILYDSFIADITNLQNICGKYVQRIEERDKRIKSRKNAKMEIFVSIFAALVAEVTLVNNSWELIEKALGRTLSFYSPTILILLGTLLSPMITIIFNVYKKMNEIKSLSKQIQAETRDHLVEDDKKRRANAKRRAKLRKKNKTTKG